MKHAIWGATKDMYWIWQSVCVYFSKEWKVVSSEDASQNLHYGVGGWLLLFYIMYAIGFLTTVVEMISPNPQALEEAYGGNLFLMRSMDILFLVVIAPVLLLIPLKHPLTPKVWIGSIWIGLTLATLLGAVAAPGRHDKVLLGLAVGLAVSALMTWYILHSKRVNVTFLNRVPVMALQTGSYTPQFEARTKRNTRIFWGAVVIVALIVLVSFLLM